MSTPKWQEDVANGRAWAMQDHHKKIRAHFRDVLPQMRQALSEAPCDCPFGEIPGYAHKHNCFIYTAREALALLDQEDAK